MVTGCTTSDATAGAIFPFGVFCVSSHANRLQDELDSASCPIHFSLLQFSADQLSPDLWWRFRQTPNTKLSICWEHRSEETRQTPPVLWTWVARPKSRPAPAKRLGNDGAAEISSVLVRKFQVVARTAGGSPPITSLAQPWGNCKQVALAGRNSKETWCQVSIAAPGIGNER